MTARVLAMEVFARAHRRQGFASDLIDEVAAENPHVAGQERRFLVQLVLGVTRRKRTLDALILPFVQRGLDNVEPVLHDILRLGAFQIAFLTQVPRHAAVHETVALADWAGRPGAKGLLNGVLRRVAELVTDDFAPFGRPDTLPADPPSMRGEAFGPPPDRRFRRLTQPVLPDPVSDPIGYLGVGFSWPTWLAEHWLARHGLGECFRLGFHFNAPPPTWLRVNQLRLPRSGYRAKLAERNIEAEPGPHPQSLRLRDGVPIRELPGYATGDFAVQDHSSMLVASALDPEPGWRVLDLCSAPGGKATHAAELMEDRGHVLACDIAVPRLDTVSVLAHRLGASIVEPRLLPDGDPGALPPPGSFDGALVDAPCSNTGVLGRRPEVRWRFEPREMQHLVALQTRLLCTAIEAVRVGGVVVYSTCSIEPEENIGVVREVRRIFPRLEVEGEAVAIPGQPSDGGYWCRLRKA